ncbi:PepSY domain-containing protein [Aestuariibacter sp. A3R04]|uniref:PepSY domain-containing protein n=1 Tax=Aestuariibacter sp. A3R04 TaxID=2841571 RepID=UPI001C08A323|nr:PepSY domain-containing protein [Aestuariibacter sp. A3R04]
MHPKLRQWSRKIHLWFALLIIVPSLVVIGTGILLQVKKQSDWIQPPTLTGMSQVPRLAFSEILEVAQGIPQLEVQTWADIDRLDIRPGKGIVKIQAKNHWEVQIDAANKTVLHVAFRRSDIIESLHDGSWFADAAKLWVFLPAGIILFFIWCTGGILLYTTLKSKLKKSTARDARR